MATSFDPASPQGAAVVRLRRATIEITGSDRQSWLNGLVTCNLAPLKAGQGAYGLAASKVGKILADLLIVVAADRLLLACPPGRLSPLREAFDGYLVMEDAETRDGSGEWAWLGLHGPEAAAAAREVAAQEGGHAAAIDLLGLGGAALVVPASQEEAALGRLRGAGVEELSEQAWEALRLERGLPQFGVDFDEKTYPQEASLERRAVSFSKGCYLGQEVICRLEMRGHVHRRLVSLALDGDPPAAGAEVAAASGEKIGAITSASRSPGSGKTVALAMVKYAHSEPGTALRVGEQEARVVAAPAGGA